MKTRNILATLAFLAFLSPVLSGQQWSSGNDNSSVPQAFQAGGDENVFRLAGGAVAGIEANIYPSFTGMKEPMVPLGFHFRFGYGFGKNMVSLLLGPEFNEEMFLPIILEYRYGFKMTDRTPYLYGQAGYSWHLAGTYENRYQFVPYKDYDAGLTFGLGAGYSFFSGQSEMHISLGYRFQSMMAKDYITQNIIDYFYLDMNCIELKLGIIFH